MTNSALPSFDTRAAAWFAGLPHPRWLQSLMWGFTIAGYGASVWLLIALILSYTHATYTPVLLVLGLEIVQYLGVSLLLKSVVKRPRPNPDLIDQLTKGLLPDSYSFPSGHSTSSFAAALVLSSLCPALTVYLVGLASCISFSRLYLAKHYTTDVLAGIAIGLIIGMIALQFA